MKTVICSLLLLSLLWAPVAGAQGMCADIFGNDLFESNHLIQVKEGKSRLGFDTILVARKTFIKKKFLRKMVENMEWEDYSRVPDLQGDIRWGAQYLLSSLKRLFGLRTLNQQGAEVSAVDLSVQFVEVPTADSVRHIFSTLESRLQENDPNFEMIKFYKVGEETFSRRGYLRHLAERGELPLAMRGHVFEHDLNYHIYSSLVTPSYVVKAIRSRAEIYLDFLKFVESRGTSGDAWYLEAIKGKLLDDVIASIDANSGNLFSVILRLEERGLDAVMQQVHSSVFNLFLDQRSPADYLKEVVPQHSLLDAYLAQAPAHFKKADLTDSFLRNPAELYNDAKAQLKILEAAAANILQSKP